MKVCNESKWKAKSSYLYVKSSGKLFQQVRSNEDLAFYHLSLLRAYDVFFVFSEHGEQNETQSGPPSRHIQLPTDHRLLWHR